MSAMDVVPRSRMSLVKEFSGWQFLNIAFVGLYALVSTLILSSLDRYIWQSSGQFVVIPGKLFWMLPGLFSAVCVAGVVNPMIFKRILKDRYPDFIAYQTAVYRVSSDASNRIALYVVLPILLIFIYLGMSHHTIFDPDRMEIRSFLSLSSRDYSYADVSAIKTSDSQTAPSGKVMVGRVYLLVFSDGELWHSEFGLNGIDKDSMRTIMSYVSQKSGKPIEEVDIFPRSESYE
jgi:hypothetical protein